MIQQAGAEFGIKRFGARALMSLRLEKSWGVWTLEYRPDFTAAQSGLDAFIDWNKNDFIGRAAAMAEGAQPRQSLITLAVDSDIDCHHDEAIFQGDECVGYVTSGGYAHSVGRSLAMGYVSADSLLSDQPFRVEILGELKDAERLEVPAYDPQGLRMRA